MEKKQKETQKREQFECTVCKQRYEMSEARRKEMACCGQPLTKTETATKGTPTPFGP